MVILTLSVASVSTMTDAAVDAAAAAILRLCIRRRGCTLKALAVASSNTLRINVCQIAARRRFATHHAIRMHAQMCAAATATIYTNRVRVYVVQSDVSLGFAR